MKKIISLLLTVIIITSNVNISFANNALKEAGSAIQDADKTFDGKTVNKAVDLTISDDSKDKTKSSPSSGQKLFIKGPEKAVIPPSKENEATTPKEPTFLEKVAWDIENNKSGYLTVGAAAGFMGFLLGGPLGMLVGIGAMMAFTITQRADYIKAFAQPPKK